MSQRLYPNQISWDKQEMKQHPEKKNLKQNLIMYHRYKNGREKEYTDILLAVGEILNSFVILHQKQLH